MDPMRRWKRMRRLATELRDSIRDCKAQGAQLTHDNTIDVVRALYATQMTVSEIRIPSDRPSLCLIVCEPDT